MDDTNQIISGSFVHNIKTIIAHAVHGDCENEENSGYYFISVKDLEPYKINYQNARQITYKDYVGAHKRTKLENGDVLFANSGDTIGKTLRVKDVNVKTNRTTFQKSIAILKPNSDIIDEVYFYYLIKYYTPGLRKAAVGSAQKNLLLDTIRNFNVEINHLLPNQRNTIHILELIDSKIELNNRINAELEAMAKTLYDYWFVQFDFPNESGKPYKTSGGKMVWNEELKSEIPEGWQVKSLAEITDVSNESINPMDSPAKKFKYYSIPGFDTSGTFAIEKGEEIKSNKFTVKATDVLVSKLNPWFSRVIYSTDDSDLFCYTEFVVWRTSDIAIKNYMYMIARDASFVTYCTQSASGTSNSHKRVNPIVMMKYQIVYNDEIARQFGTTLGSTIKMFAKNQIENQQLSELRDWLLPMLLNGQVTVDKSAENKASYKIEEEMRMAAEPGDDPGKI